MSLKAGRSGVKKSQVNPISGEVKVDMPTEIDATTINEVGIRVNPEDPEAIQYKTPNGDWSDFSSGGLEAVLLWNDPNPSNMEFAGRTINVNSEGYSMLAVVSFIDNLFKTVCTISIIDKVGIISAGLTVNNGRFGRHTNGTTYVGELSADDSKVTCGVAQSGSSWDGRYLVPTKIFGLK